MTPKEMTRLKIFTSRMEQFRVEGASIVRKAVEEIERLNKENRMLKQVVVSLGEFERGEYEKAADLLKKWEANLEIRLKGNPTEENTDA